MKNQDIVALNTAGILSITANDLEASDAFKVIKFKRAVKKALEDIISIESGALKELGVKDIIAFNNEHVKLQENPSSDPKRLEELDAIYERFREIQKPLYNEDAKLEGVEALSFPVFHALQKENRDLPRRPLNVFEDVLEGVLWCATE